MPSQDLRPALGLPSLYKPNEEEEKEVELQRTPPPPILLQRRRTDQRANRVITG
jgi:hypothetical protein